MVILSMLLLTSTLLAEMTSLTFDFEADAILYKEIQGMKYHQFNFLAFSVRFQIGIR